MDDSAEEPVPVKPLVRGQFVLNYDDWLALHAAYGKLTPWRRVRAWIYWAVIVLAVGLGVYFANHETIISVICISYAALLLVVKILVAPYYHRRVYRQSNLADAAVDMTAGIDGLRYKLQHSDSRIAWDMIRRASHVPGCMLLWLNRRQAFMVPDRAFASDDKREVFHGLVRDHVTDREI